MSLPVAEKASDAPSSDPIILIAEDEPINQMLMRSALTRAGFHAVVAQNGAQAVQLVEYAMRDHRPFSLALMDIQMPQMDGIEATRRIRSMGISPDEMPIVAFTAAYDDQRERDCLAAGMQAAVAKPLDIPTLHQLLEQWCGPVRPEGI